MKNKIVFLLLLFTFFLAPVSVFAQSTTSAPQGTTEMPSEVRPLQIPNIAVQITQPRSGNEVAFSVRLLILLTILTLAPSILILVTCFLRFSIVLDFIKRALSLQQVPPTAVLNGIAFFMTIFIMWPTFTKIYDNSLKPMSDGQIGLEEAYKKAEEPIRDFMLVQMSDDTSYIKTFMSMAKWKSQKIKMRFRLIF